MSAASHKIIATTTIMVFISLLFCGNWVLYSAPFLLPSCGKYTPQDDELFAVSTDLGDAEHALLYHDIDSAQKRIRNADVVMFGNSRMQMAWDRDRLRSEFSNNSLSFYNASCGYGEGFEFYYHLVNKYPVRGKTVLIHIDKGFQTFSIPAKDSISQPPLLQIVQFYLKQTNLKIKNFYEFALGKTLLQFFGLTPLRHLIFRSSRDGTWNTRFYLGMNASSAPCKDVYNDLLSIYSNSYLEMFIAELLRNNCTVVVTCIPTTDSSSKDARDISRASGVLFIQYSSDIESLYTFDGSHLNNESSTRFTADITHQLISIAQRSR